MIYQSPNVGNEISCVMYGVDAKVLNNVEKLEGVLLKALANDKFTILDKISHTFKPLGFTLAVLLAESHAVIHTYPEHNSLYFSIYSCRNEKDGERVFKDIQEHLAPESVSLSSRHIVVAQNADAVTQSPAL